jgi:intracellular septation protein
MEVGVVQINRLKAKQDVNPLLKITLEMGPLVIFFLMNSMKGIFYATAALMIATLVSLGASRLLLKRIPVMPLVTGAFVMVFGALTIYLQDATFIKIKPTILNLLFASVLAGGLFFRKSLLKIVLGEVLHLQEEGWRLLTIRWTGFFIVLAILNEIVWRNFSEQTWIAYKSFGVMPLTMLFMMAQITLIVKYQIPEVSAEPSEISTT